MPPSEAGLIMSTVARWRSGEEREDGAPPIRGALPHRRPRCHPSHCLNSSLSRQVTSSGQTMRRVAPRTPRREVITASTTNIAKSGTCLDPVRSAPELRRSLQSPYDLSRRSSRALPIGSIGPRARRGRDRDRTDSGSARHRDQMASQKSPSRVENACRGPTGNGQSAGDDGVDGSG